jgi:hypothetical protein
MTYVAVTGIQPFVVLQNLWVHVSSPNDTAKKFYLVPLPKNNIVLELDPTIGSEHPALRAGLISTYDQLVT